MFRPRWRKIFRDLWLNKIRTILVILSIAVGVFAIGVIVSTQIMLAEDMSKSYRATHPSHAHLFPGGFDDDVVEATRRVDGVLEADARLDEFETRIKVGPDQWKTLNLDVLNDYNDQRLDIVSPVSGAWPPPKRQLLLEQQSFYIVNVKEGDVVEIETRDGKIRHMRVAGVAHDMGNAPAPFVGEAYGYITFETLEWLGEPRHYDELVIRVDQDAPTEESIRAVADAVEKKIEKSGLNVYWTWIPEPDEHPANESVEPMLLILGVLGILSLFLSGFLVINTISAILAQQVRQIGIMKAVGARATQVIQLYIGMVLFFGLLSLLVAVPLGAWAAYEFSAYIAWLVNFDLTGFRIPPQALAVEVAVGLIVPLLAALYPIITGARITVNAAISTYGLGKGQFGTHLIDRTVEWLTGKILAVSRPIRISLRNAIRRKARLTLTLFTLTLGGAIFIAVLSVHSSLLATLDEALTYWNYDVEVDFDHAHRIEEIKRKALNVPGVVDAESWIGNTARRMYADGHEGENINVLGIPANTTMIHPTLLAGRWLLPDDENALVLNTEVLKEESDINVGDEIRLTIEGRENTWRVVGIVKGVMTGSIAYANYPYFARYLRYIGRSGGVQIVAQDHSPEFQEQLARQVKDYFDRLGMQVQETETIASIRDNIEYQFNVVVFFLAFMAVLIALVGCLGLMGTMSINVIERTREIGVMRAVGASDGDVMKIVIVEGLVIGLFSWIVGAILGWPTGRLLSDAVGVAFMESPLTYQFAFGGALLWLGIILVLAALASLLPAWNASRLSVREVLAYE
ncbi:MAG: FtsX-like permease family protein [Anaerolineae bacterium]|nr:FtsX-like permease family protein [Anaerolineae bacterium]